MSKKFEIKLIKTNRSYSFKELSNLLKVHPRTIQNWHRKGMNVIDDNSKPYLVFGYEVKQFLFNKYSQRKIKLASDEFFCMRCRTGRKSKPDNIQLEKTGKKIGRDQIQIIIRGICEICGTPLNKFSTENIVKELLKSGMLLKERPSTLIENDSNCLNTDIQE